MLKCCQVAGFVDSDKASNIPFEIVDLICWHLDPFSLARTACVSRIWRQAASADTIWRPFLKASKAAMSICPGEEGNMAVFGKLAAGALLSPSCRRRLPFILCLLHPFAQEKIDSK